MGATSHNENAPVYPAYQVDGGKVCCIIDSLQPQEVKTYSFQQPSEDPVKTERVRTEDQDGVVSITVNNEPALQYHHRYKQGKRPFFYPVMGPHRLNMTRSWPVSDKTEFDEEHDHPHHTSFWVAHGRVNECDHWASVAESGLQVHEEFTAVVSGNVFGGFSERLSWVSTAGDTILRECRSLRVWNTPPRFRIIDLSVEFQATEGDVLFGDTKEGGICALRVAEPLKGSRGGRIENAYGAVGETECWGKRAPWVDYSGVLQGNQVGITIMDHPLNPLHPTYWHVRDYGLFAANPFGLSYYKSSYETDGNWLLRAHDAAAFRYRIILHEGNAESAGIRERYHDWVNPPTVVKSP